MKKDPEVEVKPEVKVEELFSGEKHCVAVQLTDGKSDGFIYTAQYGPDGKPGKVALAEKVHSNADFLRAKNVCEAYAKFLDFRSYPPIVDEIGANEAILASLEG